MCYLCVCGHLAYAIPSMHRNIIHYVGISTVHKILIVVLLTGLRTEVMKLVIRLQ